MRYLRFWVKSFVGATGSDRSDGICPPFCVLLVGTTGAGVKAGGGGSGCGTTAGGGTRAAGAGAACRLSGGLGGGARGICAPPPGRPPAVAAAGAI